MAIGGDRILAIDLGTTAVKVAVMDEAAGVLTIASARQRTLGDAAGRREHVPEETWRAVRAATREAVGRAGGANVIRAISVTGPRGTFAIAGPDGALRTNFLTWQDRRAAATAATIGSEVSEGYRVIAGAAVDPSAVLAKLVWLRQRDPGAFADGWRIATPQADTLARLGARGLFVDMSVAAHFGLLDVTALDWSASLLATFGVPAEALPVLVAPGAQVGSLDRTVAERLGLPAGVPLIAAGSDGVCTELGAGVVDPGQLYGYLGTAATVAGPLASPALPADPALILMPGSTRERWRILGLAMAGGSARAWLMAILGMRDQGRVERLIASSPPGARGVMFVPALAGASAPVQDGRALGVFAGLSLGNDTADLVRAVHEGVALELRWLVDAIRRSGVAPIEIRLTGGASRSGAWAQILADVLALPVARIADPNPGLRGAGAYALAAIGRQPSVLAAAAALKPEHDRFSPNADCGTLYDEAAETYAHLRRSFHDGGVDERLSRRIAREAGGAS